MKVKRRRRTKAEMETGRSKNDAWFLLSVFSVVYVLGVFILFTR